MVKMEPPASYTVAWICALEIESIAAAALFDEEYKLHLDVHPGDYNKYSTGRIGNHLVALVTVQPGKISSSDLEDITKGMRQTFGSIPTLLTLDVKGLEPGGWLSAYGDEIASGDPLWDTADTIGSRVQALSPGRVQTVLWNGGGCDLGSDVGARVLDCAHDSRSLIDARARITKEIRECLSRVIKAAQSVPVSITTHTAGQG